MSFLAWNFRHDPFVQTPCPRHQSLTSSCHFGWLIESSSWSIDCWWFQSQHWFFFFLFDAKTYTDSTPKVGVDELSSSFPLEVRIIELVVLIENMQVVGELLRGSEFIYVDVTSLRWTHLIIFGTSAHLRWSDKINEIESFEYRAWLTTMGKVVLESPLTKNFSVM